MKDLPKVCLIGAGSSGITVAKSLKENGIEFDCYEKGSGIGGNWRFGNDNGLSNIYRSLHINTHRDRMQFHDFPMPSNFPDYPGHAKILSYFESYVEYFGLETHIRFSNGVNKAERISNAKWRIYPEKGKYKDYDVLIVANGHHWKENWPIFPGKFDGESIHSHSYIDPTNPISLVDKRVVVVGMGNSAMDLAVECSRPGIAKEVYLSARRGAYVIPNYLFGLPFDKLPGLIPHWFPFSLQQFFAHHLVQLAVGKMENFGLPKPDHKFGSAHPTVSQDLLVRLGRGDILPKPAIQELRGNEILFADGSIVEADVLVYCTGYEISFPFFSEDLLSIQNNEIPLFFRLRKPQMENLFFVGLVQPLGAVMPIAEAQGKWIAEALVGKYKFPSEKVMFDWIQRDSKKIQKRYVKSNRHTIQIDFDIFLHEMKEERNKGRKRAMKDQKVI